MESCSGPSRRESLGRRGISKHDLRNVDAARLWSPVASKQVRTEDSATCSETPRTADLARQTDAVPLRSSVG